ncbi:hypothetical protein BJ508DRAFT_27489 [Ascobolus immersus RN42]|uniref:Uncharacterized protein n=1 Tax=Ascobolus immersus RN42 TaxID=1160509 RepID=A0A3N4IF91_ASCIM|nr:hypothetical protein BJ508DRAFT_27489 [Ascobolus immersus RN42]
MAEPLLCDRRSTRIRRSNHLRPFAPTSSMALASPTSSFRSNSPVRLLYVLDQTTDIGPRPSSV